MARIVRTEPLRRTQLLTLTSTRTRKDAPADPILPISSGDMDQLQNSPWPGLMEQRCHPSEFLAMIMGPGPWTLTPEFQLPETCRELHFTTENLAANITITHSLRITVSASEKDTTDGRKCFKMVELIPLQILSVRSISFTPSFSFTKSVWAKKKKKVSLQTRIHILTRLLGYTDRQFRRTLFMSVSIEPQVDSYPATITPRRQQRQSSARLVVCSRLPI
jgi:hypothetical protein